MSEKFVFGCLAVFICSMLIIINSGEPSRSPGLTYDEKMARWQKGLTKQVRLMDEREKEKSYFNPSMDYKSEPLEDDLKGNLPIKELIQGFRGLL